MKWPRPAAARAERGAGANFKSALAEARNSTAAANWLTRNWVARRR